MKVILYMAISANGIIAREDGDEDFLSHKNWEAFIGLAKKTGNFIYGRKTYESVITWGNPYVNDIESIKTKLVISEHFEGEPIHGFRLAHSPQDALTALEKEGYSEVLLTGGSTNNSSFAKAGLIDEVIFNVEPVVVGKGIPVFRQENFEIKLQLENMEKLENVLHLRYKVLK